MKVRLPVGLCAPLEYLTTNPKVTLPSGKFAFPPPVTLPGEFKTGVEVGVFVGVLVGVLVGVFVGVGVLV